MKGAISTPGRDSYRESFASLFPQASRVVATTNRGKGLCHLQEGTSSIAEGSQWLEQRLAVPGGRRATQAVARTQE